MEASLNGARIHYERDGGGPAAFLMHAGCADARMWDRQVGAFARHFDVVRADARGFGASTLPDGAWAPTKDLLALMDLLEIKTSHLVGCSMGGGVAIDIAIEHPERVSRLVLVGSALHGFRNPARQQEYAKLFAEEGRAREAGDMEALNRELMRLLLDGPRRESGSVVQPLRDLFLEMNGQAIRVDRSKAPAAQLEPPAVERLHEISAPALVVIGDSDLPHVYDIAQLLLNKIPRAREAVIHDAAHLPNLEHPDEFNRIVLEFLLED